MAIHSIKIGNNTAEEINLKNKLKIGAKTYDGSAEITITASDLGLAAAMKFLGTSTTAITDGAKTNPITIGSTSTTVTSGNVVLYGSKEFVWTGSAWEELGNEGSYKVVQAAVSDPTASGNATAFIDSISQDTNGKITVTKKNVNFPTIPTVNNGTLTIQKNGVNVTTFTANQSGDSTANIAVPTKTSELTNDSGFITTDTNTTYTFATGDSNGQIKVTPSGGSTQNVSVKGLGSAAYTASTSYAPAIIAQTTDPGAGSALAAGVLLCVYED